MKLVISPETKSCDAFEQLCEFSPMLRGEERIGDSDIDIINLYNEQFDERIRNNRAIALGAVAAKEYGDGSKIDIITRSYIRGYDSEHSSGTYQWRGISMFLGDQDKPIDNLMLHIEYSVSAWFGREVREVGVTGLEKDFPQNVEEHEGKEISLDLSYDGYRRLLPAVYIAREEWSNNLGFSEKDIQKLFGFVVATAAEVEVE